MATKDFAPTATPENTSIPGGGSWRWDAVSRAWVENTPDRPLQAGEIGALQTAPADQPLELKE